MFARPSTPRPTIACARVDRSRATTTTSVGRACRYTAHDARKLKIFSAHVRDHLDGKLPRQNDVATLARWDHEDDGERDGVPVGLWWYRLDRDIRFQERLKRLRNFDEDSKHALEYLETCEPRKAKTRGRNAK